MKKLLFTLGLLASFFIASASTDSTTVEFDKLEHDFGTIQYNGDGNCVFTFTNTGEYPLLLSNVKSSCGCTVPQWPREPIAPGATGEIKVKYDTKRIGAFHKTITVYSNTSTPVLRLKIKGTVQK